MKLTIGPKIKATLALIGIFGILGLLIYSPIVVMSGVCIVMTYLLWKELYRFFKFK